MFAHQTVKRVVDLVLVRAVVAQRAVTLAKSLAWGSVGIKPESVLSSEEIGEGEVESWRSVS